MQRNINIIKKRKKLWDTMNFGYKDQPNRLHKNKSLTCKCSQCQWLRFLKVKKRRDARHKSKIDLKKEESCN